jgi:hypothetical protein
VEPEGLAGGVDYPRDWTEFEAFFRSERDCLRYLRRLRWPDGFRCPACGHGRHRALPGGLLRCSACPRKTSITAGTLFEGTRLGLRRWFLAAWFVVQQSGGVSALDLQRLLGLGSYETAWAWLHKLRRAMEADPAALRGQVEVGAIRLGDEQLGTAGSWSWVVIAVERTGPGTGPGRVRMHTVADLRGETITRFVEDAVEPGSIVLTSARNGYRPLGCHPAYRHVTLAREERERDSLAAVHRVGVLVERWLLGTHQGSVAPSQLDHYLAEWCFRFERRHERDRGRSFHALLARAARTPPQPYGDLLAPAAGERHRQRRRDDRARRARGELMPAVNARRAAPKRPGGRA